MSYKNDKHYHHNPVKARLTDDVLYALEQLADMNGLQVAVQARELIEEGIARAKAELAARASRAVQALNQMRAAA